MSSNLKITENRPWLAWSIFSATIIIVFVLGLLASSIVERRAEAAYINVPKKEISAFEPRNEVWGENYPREFQSYYGTADSSFRSKYNGNTMIDMLEVDPRLVVLWAGYGFAKDYNQGRGHYYAIVDVQNTLRTGAPMFVKIHSLHKLKIRLYTKLVSNLTDFSLVLNLFSSKYPKNTFL